MAKRKISSDRKISNKYSLKNGGSNKLVIAVTHKNEGQKQLLRTISENKVTIVSGVPGSGKTHCSVGWGLQEMLMHNRFERIIFVRPIVEAGESLGFLPGDAQQKVAPYMMPMYDVVKDYLSDDMIEELTLANRIVVMPLAYMRGITFKNAYVIADEFQNATIEQTHLLLTRIGTGSKVVITGDTEQSDLCYHRYKKENGLLDAIKRLKDVKGLGFIELGYESCVREPIVSAIDQKYRTRQLASPTWEVSPELEQTSKEIAKDMDEVLNARIDMEEEEDIEEDDCEVCGLPDDECDCEEYDEDDRHDDEDDDEDDEDDED
jgi:phosphate starvation-inducible protein PhoH